MPPNGQTIQFAEVDSVGNSISDLSFASSGVTGADGRFKLVVSTLGHGLPDSTVRRIKGTWILPGGGTGPTAYCTIYLRSLFKNEAYSLPLADPAKVNPSRPLIPYFKDASIVQTSAIVNQATGTDVTWPGHIAWQQVSGFSATKTVCFRELVGAGWSDWANTVADPANPTNWYIQFNMTKLDGNVVPVRREIMPFSWRSFRQLMVNHEAYHYLLFGHEASIFPSCWYALMLGEVGVKQYFVWKIVKVLNVKEQLALGGYY